MFGNSGAIKRYYRPKNGRDFFNFRFKDRGDHVDIFCSCHPPLSGRDSDVNKTHLFSSGQLCFVSGREPRSQARAEELAAQWAEYYLEYRRTGITQS